MDLTPYLESLRNDLAAAAAPGGPDTAKAAELLGSSLEPAMRLALLEVLSDAAAEITTRLHGPEVDVRLRGREAELVVSHVEVPPAPDNTPGPASPMPVADNSASNTARLTLRMPEQLKAHAERAAAAEGISVNAWLVRAVSIAAAGNTVPGPGPSSTRGRRITGFAQA